MPTETSYRHFTLTLMGIRVTGFAEEDSPVEFAKVPLAEVTWGRDGTMYINGTARRGGEFTLRLGPTSPFIPHVLRWMTRIEQGERITFEGDFGDAGLGVSTLLRGGVLTECPPSTKPGETFEVMWNFEEFVPQYDGAQFAGPPGGTL